MTAEIETPRTRRALLTAALGAGAATVATAIARPFPVNAADGEPVLVGGEYTADSVTKLNTGATGAYALWCQSADGAIVAIGHNGTAVEADSTFGAGVWATSTLGTAVIGQANLASTAIGVMGESDSGTGVLATTSTGTALEVVGKAKFSRSGRASVPANKKYVDVTVPGGLTAQSLVQATIQTYRAGCAILAARPNWPTAGKVRIYLTRVASTTSATPVAWIVTEY